MLCYAITMICVLIFGLDPCLAQIDPKAHNTFTFILKTMCSPAQTANIPTGSS